MTGDEVPIDRLLAAVLRGEEAVWPTNWTGTGQAASVIERIAYHGIAGLMAGQTGALAGWPVPILAEVREQGIALAMWELRHKELLGELFAAFAGENIHPLVLKGTALAYDLYPVPATRARGDSDILVAPTDLEAARSVLAGLGYRCHPLDEAIADDLALQEVWSLACAAGSTHHIDLHWQLMNAPALHGVLEYSACAADPHPLPRLAPDARAMNRILTLLHTCIHRAMHLTSPYFVNGVTYYGGDRLIWVKDIELLADALSSEDWNQFSDAALALGVATVSLDGLLMARRSLGTAIPQQVLDALGAAGAEPGSEYLLKYGQMARAWEDLWAIRGWNRKLAYLAARALPSASFMRAKYSEHGGSSLAMLHVRRVVDLVRKRPDRKAQG